MTAENADRPPIDTGALHDIAPPPPPPPPAGSRRRGRGLGRRGATIAVAGGLVVGGVAGGYVVSQAATPAPSPTPTAAGGGHGPHRGLGGAGPAARAEDLAQAAAVIGITETQLQTELTAGKTIAAVAKEHNVAAATVISTLVTDENAEIDARVASGQLTAALGAQMKTTTQQRVTDQVNGTFPRPTGNDPRRGHDRPFGGPPLSASSPAA